MRLEKSVAWLAAKGVHLEESFTDALRKAAYDYMVKNHIRSIEEVYRRLGVRKEYLYYWRTHPNGMQTKNF